MLNITELKSLKTGPISLSENSTIDKVSSNSEFSELKIRVKTAKFKVKTWYSLF